MAAAEREVSKAEERMYDLTQEIEAASSDYLKLTELYEQREALEEEIAHLYANWERLSAELEEAKAEGTRNPTGPIRGAGTGAGRCSSWGSSCWRRPC